MKKKVKKWRKNKKKTQEYLNNIRIRFPKYENECYAKRTRILRTMGHSSNGGVALLDDHGMEDINNRRSSESCFFASGCSSVLVFCPL